jgi:hypothetical protein
MVQSPGEESMGSKRTFSVVLEKAEGSEACGINIPAEVKAALGPKARVPVRGTLNGFPYRSAVVPMGGRFLMAVNRAMREGAKVEAGDVVDVVMEPDDEPRAVVIPPDLALALAADPAARNAWDRSSFTHRKEFVLAVEEAKKPETRARRVAKALEAMKAKGER